MLLLKRFPYFLTLAIFLAAKSAFSVDFANGEMLAVPVKNGQAPVIDADLSDWELNAQEPIYISAQSVENMNAEWAVMYDAEALYVSCVAAMPDRTFFNNNNPQDAYWSQDIAQIRLSADPDLAYPLNRQRDQESSQIVHVSFWTNHETGESFMAFQYGTRFQLGNAYNPAGSAIAMDISSSKQYVLEAKIPWSALNVPGGRNPFKPGQIGVFTAESLWIGGDKARTLLNYNRNPGVFAFSSPQVWGKLKYVEQAPKARLRPTMESVVATAQASLNVAPAQVGVPFTIEVPDDGLKASVNIVDANGGVVREVIGGEVHSKGPLTLYWDGRDAFQKLLPLGEYRWAAYFHKPLKAVYQGSVGSSANTYYQTLDGTGGWGGDHSNPIDVHADTDSLYFLWPVAEAGQSIVRTDYEGQIIWRKDPFVGGGFGPFYSAAVNDKYVFLSRSDDQSTEAGKTSIRLVRILKDSGSLTVWDQATRQDEIQVVTVDHQLLPRETIASPILKPHGKEQAYYENGLARQPDGAGLAADEAHVYVASYGAGKIFVMDAESGQQLRTLECPGVRGLYLTENGDLYAVSFAALGEGEVLKFTQAQGVGVVVVSDSLEAPWDVAVDAQGLVYVSDLGDRQNIQVFNQDGQRVKEIGQLGGRPWQGSYDSEALSFLCPAGINFDQHGALLISESSLPKVFSQIDLNSNTLLNRWYGPSVYWNGTWPMPEDPRNIFYQLVHGIGRADLAEPGAIGVPNTYWNLEYAGFEHVGNIESMIPQPEVIRAENGELYFVKDSGNHVICVLRDSIMRPVAKWTTRNSDANGRRYSSLEERWVEVWIDQNGDGLEQASEIHRWDQLLGGEPIGAVAEGTSSMHMEANGDLYFMTHSNQIVRVPASGFSQDGMIGWDLDQAHAAVPVVMPGLERMSTGFRAGLLGARLDADGNIYTLFNTALKGTGGSYDFADEVTAKRMKEGMGHTSRSNVVKFAKFNSKGELLWMAGRKATAGAASGEMYHFWNMAGIVNDRYIAGGSEWGQIYFYTHDGFFVDALMNNPGEISEPGPYTFGGETSGGRVAYFDASGELWAYSSGMAYQVEGFSNGQVEGESRAYGTLELDQIYSLASQDDQPADPIHIVAFSQGNFKRAEAWQRIPRASLHRQGTTFAQAQFAYDAKYLFARIQVQDASPLQNGATENKLAFKGGDTAGFVIGPDGDRKRPELGDLRVMVASIDGTSRLLAMKAVSKTNHQPEVYETPAAGRWEFDFVGEIPGGDLKVETTDNGYVVYLAVPLEFIEFDLKAQESVRGDVEIRLSGVGQRGLQATSRNYLFTPSTSETTMVDDVPTEARMYPEYWGTIQIK